MLHNNDEYKKINLDTLNFSVRLLNAARRNGLRTLYDLLESYSSGAFAEMRNVGKNTIQGNRQISQCIFF